MDDLTQLLCSNCGRVYDPDGLRFCSSCGLPLVHASRLSETLTEAHRRARKIKPQLAEGELTRVVGARNLSEAEFIQALLLEEGVPSLLRRARGFDVPDFLAAGPRDVLVPASGVMTAREVLLQSDLLSTDQSVRAAIDSPWRVLVVLVAVLAVAALVLWLALL